MGTVYISETMDFGKYVEVPDEVIAGGMDAIFAYVCEQQSRCDSRYSFDFGDCRESYGMECREVDRC